MRISSRALCLWLLTLCVSAGALPIDGASLVNLPVGVGAGVRADTKRDAKAPSRQCAAARSLQLTARLVDLHVELHGDDSSQHPTLCTRAADSTSTPIEGVLDEDEHDDDELLASAWNLAPVAPHDERSAVFGIRSLISFDLRQGPERPPRASLLA